MQIGPSGITPRFAHLPPHTEHDIHQFFCPGDGPLGLMPNDGLCDPQMLGLIREVAQGGVEVVRDELDPGD